MQKSFLKLTGCLALLSILSLSSCRRLLGMNDEPAIGGKVLSGMTGSPIAGSVVTLKQGGTAIASVTTGADGSFGFNDVENGDGYTVSASSVSIYLEAETTAFEFSGAPHGKDIMLERNWPAAGTLVAGTTGTSGDTPSTFRSPYGLAFGPDGTLYVSDLEAQKIRMVTPGNPTITDYAGTGAEGSADGPIAAATFYSPLGLCSTPDGVLYVVDCVKGLIRKIEAGEVSTVAGKVGFPFTNLEGGDARSVSLPQPAFITSTGGYVYFASLLLNRVYKLSGGTIEKIAGTGEYDNTGDGGPAVDAKISGPTGIAAGQDGSIYFVGGTVIRKIDTAGNISTIATDLGSIRGMAIDAAGTLYIANDNRHCIYNVKDGVKTVIAGTLNSGGDALNKLKYPEGIAIGPDGYLYVADNTNYRILRF
jgi:sugar lactone lactonase YvrE